MTVVVAGGSGFIGTLLTQKLLALKDTVIVVDKVAPRFTHERLYFIQSDIATEQLPFNVLEHTDAVVNLVGAPIAHKWTSGYKKAIFESRTTSTRHIVESIRQAINRPMILINASAVGYYGDGGEGELTEQSPKGEGFLSDVVAAWEKEARAAEDFGVRVVCVRTAPVVGERGFVPSLARLSRLGILFTLSKKSFWQPWIHHEDIVNLYLFALQTSTLQGPINAAAPEAVTHQTFIRTLAKVLHCRIILWVPRFLKKILFGELFEEMTKSARIVSQRSLDKGFVFTYPTLTQAFSAFKKKTNEKN